MIRIAHVILMTLLVVRLVGAQTYTAEQILAKMDENSRSFKTLQASIERVETNNLARKVQIVSGKMYVSKTSDNLRIKVELTDPKNLAQTALVDKGVGQVYDHVPNIVSERKLGSLDSMELLLMGFGVSSERIKKNYLVALTGQETIEGKRTSVLELTATATDPEFPRIKLWISHEDWNAVQIELFEPTRDSNLIKYRNVKRNQSISNSVFKLDLPRNVKKAG